jgi:hypothetical protein
VSNIRIINKGTEDKRNKGYKGNRGIEEIRDYKVCGISNND